MNKFISTAAMCALVSACAGTQDNSGQTSVNSSTKDMVAVSDKADPNMVRCKSIIKTGTRLGTKVCKTNAQWDQASRDAREAAESIQRTSTHGPAGEGN